MDAGMISASVTMNQLQKSIDTIGNNLANSNTYGYKSRQTQFSDLLFQQYNNLPGETMKNRQTPYGIRVGSGARAAQTNLNLKEGSIQQTGRPLDLALLNPNQFFQVQSAGNNGNTAYTRDGAFYLSPDANNPKQMHLVTKQGDFVLGKNGPIQIPADHQKVTIDSLGRIEVKTRNGQTVQAGQLALARIKRPQLLESKGGNKLAFPNLRSLNLRLADVVQPVQGNQAQVKQAALENSNVDLTKEMTDLINAQRAYDFNAKAVTISDETLQLINNIR